MDHHEDSATIKFRMASAAARGRLGLPDTAPVRDARGTFWAFAEDRPTGLLGPFKLVYGESRPAVHVEMQPSMSEAREALQLQYLEAHALTADHHEWAATGVLWTQIVLEGGWLFVHARDRGGEFAVALDARRVMAADGSTPGVRA